MDFELFWTLMSPDSQFNDRKKAAEVEWNQHPEKHIAIIQWLKKHGQYKNRNPFFFIQDFKVSVGPMRVPTNWNGHPLQDGIQYVTAKYNGIWGTYTLDDARDFNMEVRQ